MGVSGKTCGFLRASRPQQDHERFALVQTVRPRVFPDCVTGGLCEGFCFAEVSC